MVWVRDKAERNGWSLKRGGNNHYNGSGDQKKQAQHMLVCSFGGYFPEGLTRTF